jgi:hypothetical protein
MLPGTAAGDCFRRVAVRTCGRSGVDEQIVGHGRAAEQGGQYQQARVRGRAREHGTALFQK